MSRVSRRAGRRGGEAVSSGKTLATGQGSPHDTELLPNISLERSRHTPAIPQLGFSRRDK